MLTDNVYVLDETSDAKPAPIIHLDASHRKPKDYHFFFTGFSKAVKILAVGLCLKIVLKTFEQLLPGLKY